MRNIVFKKIELEDRDLIQSYYDRFPSRSCEKTFASTFLWSKHYKVTYAMINNTIVFCSNVENRSFSFPLGEEQDVKTAIDELYEYAKEEQIPFVLYNVTEEQWELMETWFPGKYEISYNRDVADYVYESEKLATLAGKKLHSKRNHINRFKSDNENWSYESMSENNLEECFQMALRWRQENHCDGDCGKMAEMCVTLNSLRLFKELHLIGGVLRVNGEVVAFSIGEAVMEDTFVVHIEKAYADLQGAYPMINQQLVANECGNYKYINREDDAGSEGLRKAKLSYRPAFMIQKGIVKERES